MSALGKILVVTGILLAVVGLALILLSKTNLPLGRLPGDLLYHGKHTTIYAPLATSLFLSALLSLILYAVNRLRR